MEQYSYTAKIDKFKNNLQLTQKLSKLIEIALPTMCKSFKSFAVKINKILKKALKKVPSRADYPSFEIL